MQCNFLLIYFIGMCNLLLINYNFIGCILFVILYLKYKSNTFIDFISDNSLNFVNNSSSGIHNK